MDMAVISPIILPLKLARLLTDEAMKTVRESGIPACIAVVDGGGHLVLVTRMDGAVVGAIDSSIAKARTAVYFGASTSDLSGGVSPGGPMATIETASSTKLAFVAGGVPILDPEGVVIGGIGAGGGSPGQDHAAVSAAARMAGGVR
ncbi:heme-binding protein [Herbiconiux sp. CPCC 205716]|uniref:Heme-binding protein n=1 Tax=Herbiconiux gentiana TaxID=2970912 RepID=A0ABT2GEW7_9MICO|nr:heme-binding protein [Herbiconiux gentiana]MCS5714182.1 heme-binding protein [Herbiconiux gentiana]